MKRASIAVLGMAVVAAACAAGVSAFAPKSAVGIKAADVRFTDVAGKPHSVQSSLPAVYLFLGTQCPISNAYAPRIQRLAKSYRPKGVTFFDVNSNALESKADVARHAKERGFSFPAVKDGGALASALGATVTPQAIIVDSSGVIRYRGRIDDSKDVQAVKSHDLQDALDSVLANKPVKNPITAAFGCSIVVAAPKAGTARGKITYAGRVASILNEKCVACHRKGEVAPFSLENWQQAANWAGAIKDATLKRRMPPWKADSHGEFQNERRLTDAEIQTITEWVDSGAPSGDQHTAPKPPAVGSAWPLGKPDVVYSMPQSYDVGPEGRDEYRCFVIPTGYTDDKWVTGMDFHPGNRAIVHHIIAYLDFSGKARSLDEKDPGPGYKNPTPGSGPGFFPTMFLGGWAPGNEARKLPDGVGTILPAGADIVLEVHYHRNGKPEKDKTQVGVYFATAPIDKRIRMLPIVNPYFYIPPGASNHEVLASMPVMNDITVLSVTPHMHQVGRDMTVRATLPDKTTIKPLVKVPDWDFNWQITYMYREPIKLPKGSTLSLTAHYDNSTSNPRNPNNPPKPVKWGEQTTDEMCIAFVAYTNDDEHLTKGVTVKDLFDFVSERRTRRGQ